MTRRMIRILAALTLLAAAGASAAPAPRQITDGTSNTIFLPEAPPNIPAPPPVVEPEPEPAPPSAALTGSGKLRAAGETSVAPFPATLAFDTNDGTFSLTDGDGALFIGHLAAKGSKGSRYTLFLDGSSRDAFASKLATRAAAMTGRPAGFVSGETLKLELTLDGAGARLKLKCNVLTSELGEVVLKANLSGGITL